MSDEQTDRTDRAPAPFDHDEYVRYNQRLMNAIGCLTLAAVVGLFGLSLLDWVWKYGGGSWKVVLAMGVWIVNVVIIGSLCWDTAKLEFRQAESIRRAAQYRPLVAGAYTLFMVAFTTAVLQNTTTDTSEIDE